MNRKLPPEAFAYYVALGPGRSYEAVATKFGCTKRGIADCAKRERWQERIVELEQRGREKVDEQAIESIAEMNDRHLKIARYLQSKGLEGLQGGQRELMAPSTKTCTAGIELERLIRGEPTERSASSVEAIIRREYDLCMVPVADKGAGKPDAEPAGDGDGAQSESESSDDDEGDGEGEDEGEADDAP